MSTTTLDYNLAEVASSFQRKPAYRYIRKADKILARLPHDASFDTTKCLVKLFDPTGAGTWYIASYDATDGVAYGVADLGYGPEFGAIYIPELVDFRGRFGLPIERDLHWKPKTITALLEGGR
jgi:hypothetical protein